MTVVDIRVAPGSQTAVMATAKALVQRDQRRGDAFLYLVEHDDGTTVRGGGDDVKAASQLYGVPF